MKKYGPFGSSSGASSLSIPVEGGFISGFHGRGGTYLTAIGVFVAPNVNGLHSMKDHYYAASQLKVIFYLLYFSLIHLVNQNSHAHFPSHKIVAFENGANQGFVFIIQTSISLLNNYSSPKCL